LSRTGDANATGDGHLDFFAELAERAYEERFASSSSWYEVMDDELDNFRAALDCARTTNLETEIRSRVLLCPLLGIAGKRDRGA
jgi:hypothetical protein